MSLPLHQLLEVCPMCIATEELHLRSECPILFRVAQNNVPNLAADLHTCLLPYLLDGYGPEYHAGFERIIEVYQGLCDGTAFVTLDEHFRILGIVRSMTLGVVEIRFRAPRVPVAFHIPMPYIPDVWEAMFHRPRRRALATPLFTPGGANFRIWPPLSGCNPWSYPGSSPPNTASTPPDSQVPPEPQRTKERPGDVPSSECLQSPNTDRSKASESPVDEHEGTKDHIPNPTTNESARFVSARRYMNLTEFYQELGNQDRKRREKEREAKKKSDMEDQARKKRDWEEACNKRGTEEEPRKKPKTENDAYKERTSPKHQDSSRTHHTNPNTSRTEQECKQQQQKQQQQQSAGGNGRKRKNCDEEPNCKKQNSEREHQRRNKKAAARESAPYPSPAPPQLDPRTVRLQAIRNDPYAVLQVRRNASMADIRSAYKRLAIEHHPDKNQDDIDGATERFKIVQGAYDLLGDEKKRAKHDRDEVERQFRYE